MRSSASLRIVRKQSQSSRLVHVPCVETLENRQLLSGITPVIASDNLPSNVLGGARLKSSIKLDLTNSGDTTEQGFTVQIFASSTPSTLTTGDALVTSVIKSNRIAALKTLVLNVPITGLPASLPNGTYYLIAQTTDVAGNVDAVPTNSTVTVAAPFLAFSSTVSSTFPPSLVSGSPVKGSVKVLITNNGNVPARGVTSINVSASVSAGAVGTSIATTSKKVNIPVGRSITVSIPVKALPVLADGTYSLVAQVTDPDGNVTLGSSPELTIAAPFVTLSGAVATITNPRAGATVLVTNNGNVADLTRLHGTFGLSLSPTGTPAVGSTVTLSSGLLNIKPGKTAKFHVPASKAFLSQLTSGITYYLTVAYSDDTSNIGTAVSNGFTI